MNKEPKKEGSRFFNNVADFFIQSTKLVFRMSSIGIRQVPFRSFYFWAAMLNMTMICFVVAHRPPKFLADYLQNNHWPMFLQRILLLGEHSQFRQWFYFTCFLVGLFCVFGFVQFFKQRKLQKSLDSVRLGTETNRPRVLSVICDEDKKTRLKIHSFGIGFEKYESKKGDLEAGFGQTIEAIYPEEGNPQVINITMSKIPLPKLILFDEHSKELGKEGDFLIGQSRQGFIVQNIAELPHLLIAGTTGSGKSVFFKQALLGLMQITPKAKFFLMDFKRGVEFGCFSSVPDVQVIKTKSSALAALKSVRTEMQSRFDYLEKEKITKLNPEVHNFPRIIVAVDEASELLALPDRLNPDKETVAEARQIVNEIAKLGRAAAIHLIIATQKVSKTIIDTALQENIGGRMAFRMATLANSAQVIGAKDAKDLPEYPGRAIWNFGTKFIEVQVPFMDEKELHKRIKMAAHVRAVEKPKAESESDASEKAQNEKLEGTSAVEVLTK